MGLRDASASKKCVFFWSLPESSLPPSPQLCTTFFYVKNDVLARITEPCKDDYDNDGSDNCDQNFGTFDDLGVKFVFKMTKKYHIT